MNDWRPLSPGDLAEAWQDVAVPWWLAGGFAMDHAAGRRVRDHDDIDVLILRRDFELVRRVLGSWQFYAAVSGRLEALGEGAMLPDHAHDVWCRADVGADWQFQIMVDEADGASWVSRRDHRVRRAVGDLGNLDDGINYLIPEIQLYYKAKSRRAKDEVDFAAVSPCLSGTAVVWLIGAITMSYGSAHPWVDRLRNVRR